jgi:hypothetical protein
MAYVVARRGGRFEIRESLHTTKGPRARTLAGFGALTESVLAAATRRAQRPFDAEAVIRSARRARAPVRVATSGASRASDRVHASDRFVTASKRMAVALGAPAIGARADAGAALLELLGFADTVRASQPPRPFEPLGFPVLAELAARRQAGAAVAQRP